MPVHIIDPGSKRQVDETLSNNRWLPPSPHREAVLKMIEDGRAYIKERGHATAPLLVFEGEGGVIELPRVRYTMTHRGMEIVAADDSSSEGQTRHRDVCGSLDEFKGLLKDDPKVAASQPDFLNRLLDDAVYMITRMERRAATYRRFASDVAALCERMASIETPDAESAHRGAEELRALLREAPEKAASEPDEFNDRAEAIRDVANKLEACLRAHRDAAVEMGVLHTQLRGGRRWGAPEDGQPSRS